MAPYEKKKLKILITESRDPIRSKNIKTNIVSAGYEADDCLPTELSALSGYALVVAHFTDFRPSARKKLEDNSEIDGRVVWYSASYGADLLHITDGNDYTSSAWQEGLKHFENETGTVDVSSFIAKMHKVQLKEFVKMLSPLSVGINSCTTVAPLANYICIQLKKLQKNDPSWVEVIKEQCNGAFDECSNIVRELSNCSSFTREDLNTRIVTLCQKIREIASVHL